jgi:site-specific DNA-methyltransferase (adenine-specific)
MPDLTIRFGDNLDVLRPMADRSIDLIYIDPPFNTGKVQRRATLSTIRDEHGDRTGFQGRRYRTVRLGTKEYADFFDDYLSFMEPRLVEARRILKVNGSIFVHIDYREVHYVKVMMDTIFGRGSFMNEIIWAYDYGARSRTRWPAKHDNILWYAVDPDNYQFHLSECDRIPYMAPGLVGPAKAALGKTPTDTWWHTIVSPNGREKTGYPTQKPRGIVDRIVKVHSAPGDILLDFFAGSGTLGESALALGRKCVLVDNNPEAMAVMERRFESVAVEWIDWNPSARHQPLP